MKEMESKIQVRNLNVGPIIPEKPFEANFELVNNDKDVKPIVLYIYIDDGLAGHIFKFFNPKEIQKIRFTVKPEYYNANSKELIITTKNNKDGVLATHPLNFSEGKEAKVQDEKAETENLVLEKQIEKFAEISEPRRSIIKRIKSGIIGLDEKMEGGFVENSINLITGKTGTGKSAFAASFLYQGAKEGESGVYLTTEERSEDIKEDIRAMFGWDFDELERKNLLKIISMKPIFPSQDVEHIGRLVRSYVTNLLNDLEVAIKNINAKRVVIDSVSIIEMFIKDEYLARVALASLLNNLREMKVTTLLAGTVPETSEGLSGGGIIEFLVDSVIKLEFMPIAEDYKRTLTIRKMRRTDHSVQIMPLRITKRGLELIKI